MTKMFEQYSSAISRIVGRLGKWEGRILWSVLIACSVLVMVYGEAIFATYPSCPPENDCPYLVPVFTGDTVPPLAWLDFWDEFGVVFDSRDISMRSLAEVGRSGALRDPMMATGLLAALAVLWLSVPLQWLYRQMVQQMEQDGLVPRQFRALAEVEKSRRVWSWTLGLIISLLMLVGGINYAEGYPSDIENQVFLWGTSILGIVAGHRLGTALAYGKFARRFNEISHGQCLLPDHADKAGGWRRFGEFMAYQAVLMLIPLIWLSTWIYIGLQQPDAYVSCIRTEPSNGAQLLTQICDHNYLSYSTYAGWLQWQIPLLLIMVLVTYFGLVRPFFKATVPYRLERSRLMRDHVAQLDGPLTSAVAMWRDLDDLEQKQAASKAINELTQARENIWALPLVPLRSVFTGVFSISALYPLVALSLGVLLPKDDQATGATRILVDFLRNLGL